MNGREQHRLPFVREANRASLKEPSHSQKKDLSNLEDWWTMQSMLVSWVLNAVEPSLRSNILYQKNVKDLWEDIKERFSIENGPRIQQIKPELAKCQQTKMTIWWHIMVS
jgi:hypothetical protein